MSLTLFIQLIDGDISPEQCREEIANSVIDYLSDISFIEDLDAVQKAKKTKLVKKRLIELVNELQASP